jgi:hypothetical protein
VTTTAARISKDPIYRRFHHHQLTCELGQEAKWSHERSIDWESLADPSP